MGHVIGKISSFSLFMLLAGAVKFNILEQELCTAHEVEASSKLYILEQLDSVMSRAVTLARA